MHYFYLLILSCYPLPLVTSGTITIRDDTCTKCTIGKSVEQCQKEGICKYGDIGAKTGKTQCGTSALDPMAVGVDANTLGKDGQWIGEGNNGPQTRCGEKIKISANGREVIGVITDRVAPGSGLTTGTQADVSSAIAEKLGMNGRNAEGVLTIGPALDSMPNVSGSKGNEGKTNSADPGKRQDQPKSNPKTNRKPQIKEAVKCSATKEKSTK